MSVSLPRTSLGYNTDHAVWETGTVSEPGNRFSINGFHHGKKGSRLNTIYPRKAHSMTKSMGAFNASFFGISPSEAKAMDPQQRMMLEVTYEAFENAGMPLESIAGTNTACYVGASNRDYRESLYRDPYGAPLYTLASTGDEIYRTVCRGFSTCEGPASQLRRPALQVWSPCTRHVRLCV